jgi:diacylglycerol kinase (ATP)
LADSNFSVEGTPAVVFVNPAAGGGRARKCVPELQEAFRVARVPAEFILTENAEQLASRSNEALENGVRLLVAFGGDGTFQGLVNAAFGADVVLGILPGGGGNDLAAALRLPSDPVAAARMILDGKPKAIDVARARTADGRERIYVGGGGLGIDAEAATHASTTFRNFPGRSRYIASALRALATYKRSDVRAEFPESDLPAMEMNAVVAAVLNTPTYGAGIRLAPEAQINDGLLDMAIVEGMSRVSVLRLLPGLMKDGKLRTERIRRHRAKKMRLITKEPRMFHGDGEVFGATPVEIEALPGAVRILVPEF